MEKLELCSLLVGMEDDTAAMEKKKTLMVSQKAKHYSSYDSTFPLLNRCPPNGQ